MPLISTKVETKNMHNTKSFHQPQRLNGFSVIELMVALAITAFLLIGLVQIFSSVRASYDLQEGLSRLQENARFATSFMQDQLRDAGYFPFPEHENPLIDIGFTFTSVLTGDVPPPVTANTVDGSGTNSDTLEVNIFDERDCSGNLNPPTTTGNPAIGQKQIVFAHDAVNNGDGSADVYVNDGNWLARGNVVAIRVGLILTSPNIGTLPPDDQVINLLNTDFPATSIPQLRRPVVFNINLRNLTL
jgi:type II secretory pathway pseudopilin PulG